MISAYLFEHFNFISSYDGIFNNFNCRDTPNPGVPLTTLQQVEFMWISGDPIPHCFVPFIGIHIFTKIKVSFVQGALPNIQLVQQYNHNPSRVSIEVVLTTHGPSIHIPNIHPFIETHSFTFNSKI